MGESDVAEQLRQLDELRASGALTEAEFSRAKAMVLGDIGGSARPADAEPVDPMVADAASADAGTPAADSLLLRADQVRGGVDHGVSPPDAAVAAPAAGETFPALLQSDVSGEAYHVPPQPVAPEMDEQPVLPDAPPADTDLLVALVDGAGGGSTVGTTIVTGSRPAARLPGRRRWLLVAALLVVAAAGTSVWWAIDRAAVEVLGPSERGEDAFGPSFVTQSVSPSGLVSTPPPSSGSSISGDVEGLYQGTTGKSACDRSKLASFLASSDIERPWAAPLTRRSPGLDPPVYVARLTPVVLRSDTRVTAHRLVDGTAKSFQALLLAGTAVLVDDLGIPRVRCADASPLTGFSTGLLMHKAGPNEVVITQSFKTIPEFALADAAGGAQFRRPVATAGEADIAPVTATGTLRNEYYVTGTKTYCDLTECANYSERGMLTSFSGCPASCAMRIGEVEGPVPMTFDGSRWRGSGTMKPDFGFTCNGIPDPPTSFTIAVAVTSASVSHGIWTATAVTVDYENSGGHAPCDAAREGWTLSGPRGSG